MSNDFLDSNYEVPKGPSNYMKIEPGENKLRILGKPLIYWSYFNNETKPVRIEGMQQPAVDKNLIKMDKFGNQELKHFWAMLVWNYKLKQIQVLELGQKSIQETVQGLAKNPDWGNPFLYDLTITKTGSGKETSYDTVPSPPKPLSDEAKEAYKAKPCNIKALLVGQDPFGGAKAAAPVQAPVAAPIAEPASLDPNANDLPF